MLFYALLSICYLNAIAFRVTDKMKYPNSRYATNIYPCSLGHLRLSNLKRTYGRRQAIPLDVSTLQDIEGLSQAFTGGTVGVMSIMFLLEIKKLQDQQLEGCPYCLGSGEILCASCLGNGKLNMRQSSECFCPVCSGRGVIVCINCKGDGRLTPIILQSKAVRDPEYASQKSISIDSP